ncbi:MFS transporter [Sphingomonas sp. EC-HK361]|uniref:MFS transporter n=1 Tax=Sphingomonas sp. EC-HK361 TaxID=2038397 RepID=UPI001256DEFB|nr:MFS transporter [Sphingomonas sp. EC-HK361]VVT07828.1 MFS transporter [Sphingomonas sp. EC-HK361]
MESILAGRRARWAFVAGCVAVTAGVILHLPMFLMARSMHYHMAGMPMDAGMLFGMALIVGGTGLAGYGLLPRDALRLRARLRHMVVEGPQDAPLGSAHWVMMGALVVALTIDVMKPASLGFTLSGMTEEYGVLRATASLVPFAALSGTVVGSIVWGFVADIYGRKASILLSAVMFVGTSICGAMPSLAWNVAMCFMMGAAAGGMLPVTYALLAEMMPNRHRGWSLVLVGGLGAAGGYFAASGLSAILQPIFGWRILWLANLPTGLLLIFLGRLIPESPRYLVVQGRLKEAASVLRRFGGGEVREERPAVRPTDAATPVPALRKGGALMAFSIVALAWGCANFGLLLWLPADLVARGYSVGVASALLAKAALIAVPTIFAAALLYSRWSSKGSLIIGIAVLVVGLGGVLWIERQAGEVSPVLPVAALIIGVNAIIAILLPYVAESFPARVRGRATGWVAACSKAGGLGAQALAIAGAVPQLATVAALILVPAALSLALIAWLGRETRGTDLNQLDTAIHA